METSQEVSTERLVDRPEKEPVLIENSALQFPDSRNLYASEYYGPIEVECDYYGPPDDEEPLDYNRNYQYENLRVKSVALQSIIASVYRCQMIDIPSDFLAKAEEKGWGEKDFWDVEAVGGYYGEEIEIVIPSGFQAAAEKLYWSLPNAVDPDNILPYVRSKGTQTEGLTPLEALKAQFMEENDNCISTMIQYAKFASSRVVKFEKIRIPSQKHYDEVSRRKPESHISKESTFVGVLYPDQGGFILLDGYHRLKHEKEQLHAPSKGKFIIVY